MRVSSLLLAIAAIADTVYGEQFRCDYRYDYRSNRYYKYHEIPATWDEAQLRCYFEGAVLASPLTQLVASQLTSLISYRNKYPDPQILIGVAAKHSIGDFITIEGVSLNELATACSASQPRINENDDNSVSLGKDGQLTIQPARVHLPYVCYKRNATLKPFNPQCGTTDPNYSLQSTGSCYKFHREPRVWSSAHMACRAEGGYLVIINSKKESEILKNLFAKNPPNTMIGKFDKNYAHIGFRDWHEHGTWRTIQGESLVQAGFNKWAPGEPNNINAEFCGSVYRKDALLNDISCNKEVAFICEKDPLTLVSVRCDNTPKPEYSNKAL